MYACSEQWLKKQVSVMRKELKNLRQHVESSVRAHRSHVASLQSTLEEVLDKKTATKSLPSSSSSSAQSEVGTELSLEKGHIRTVPIGFITSCFTQKNGTPRQPSVCSSSRARLKIQTSVFTNPEHALTGLQQYSHVWLIFLFHKNGHMSCKAKVKPPRLNGEKVGVYSTRSPHRPNAIGLTLAKLNSIKGDVLQLSGVDLISGTPVLDIKPYIPEYDSPLTHTQLSSEPHHTQELEEEEELVEGQCVENSMVSSCGVEAEEQRRAEIPAGLDVNAVLEELREFHLQGAEDKHTSAAAQEEEEKEKKCEWNSSVASWIRKPPVHTLSVRFTPTAERQLSDFLPPHCSDTGRPTFHFFKGPEEAAAAIRGVLSADPRSVYRRKRCSDRLFYFTLDTAHITCWFGDGFAEVLQVRPTMNPDGGAQGPSEPSSLCSSHIETH